MYLNINGSKTCWNIPECMLVEEIRHATQEDNQLNVLTAYVINGWSSARTPSLNKMPAILAVLRWYGSYRWVIMKGRRIILPASLQGWATEQLHINHLGIDNVMTNTWIYKLVNINTDIEMLLKIPQQSWISPTQSKDWLIALTYKANHGKC